MRHILTYTFVAEKKTKAKNTSGNGSEVTKWNFQWSPLNKRCSLSLIFGGKPFADSWRELTPFNRKWPGFPKLFEKWVLCNVIFCDNCAVMSRCQVYSVSKKKTNSYHFFLVWPLLYRVTPRAWSFPSKCRVGLTVTVALQNICPVLDLLHACMAVWSLPLKCPLKLI